VTRKWNSPCCGRAHVPARALSPRRGTQAYPTSVQALPKANAHYTSAFTAASAHSSRQGLLKRLEITGARWGLAGAEAVLKLRALVSNGDLDAYWRYHLDREHHRVHQNRYQDRYALTA
jgi:hypothetical protein